MPLNCAGVSVWNSLLMTLGAAAAYGGNGGGLFITSSPDIQDCVFKLLAVRITHGTCHCVCVRVQVL